MYVRLLRSITRSVSPTDWFQQSRYLFPLFPTLRRTHKSQEKCQRQQQAETTWLHSQQQTYFSLDQSQLQRQSRKGHADCNGFNLNSLPSGTPNAANYRGWRDFLNFDYIASPGTTPVEDRYKATFETKVVNRRGDYCLSSSSVLKRDSRSRRGGRL